MISVLAINQVSNIFFDLFVTLFGLFKMIYRVYFLFFCFDNKPLRSKLNQPVLFRYSFSWIYK